MIKFPHVAARFLTVTLPVLAVSAQSSVPPSSTPVAAAPAEKKAVETYAKAEFSPERRAATLYYPNVSQGRLTVAVVKRIDPEISAERDYYIGTLTGSGIYDPVEFDVDDASSLKKLTSILERFVAEAAKSAGVRAQLAKRRDEASAALSRAETRLVELKLAAHPDSAAIAGAEAEMVTLRASANLADDIAGMQKISGVMGSAKLNWEHPPYDFIATFEPGRNIFLLSAGYSFNVSASDSKYFLNLLNRSSELKETILKTETRNKAARAGIERIFKDQF